MATDIKISELNEITVNNDLNQIIINSRENSGDSGITKKIQVSNFLTPNIVKTGNITDCAVTTNKIDSKAVTFNKIADNTITSNQVTCCGISNGSLATNSVDNRTINNSDNFTFNCVTAATNVNTPLATVTNKLTVGALGCGKTVSLNGINYDFPATEVPNYFLQTDGSGNLSWAEAVPGDGTALVFSDIVPVGTIIPWAGAALPADGKWLECNGTTFNGTNYPELSAVLGDTWGTHSGSNYYLPNLQGRVAVGSGTGNDGTDSCTFTFGTSGGKYNHTLCIAEMPSHQHTSGIGDASAAGRIDYFGINTDPRGDGTHPPDQVTQSTANSTNSPYTSFTGGGASHNNIQPYAVTRYIIKALPDDIQQFAATTGPGLSSRNINGVTNTIDLSTTEIGLKVTDDFQFDGSGSLTLNDSVSASSITFDDGTVQTTGEPTAYYGVMVSDVNNRTTPAQMRADRSTAYFYGAWDEYSKGWINTGYNNSGYASTNSLMYTMHVNVLQNTVVTMYNFHADDYFYIYQDDVLLYTGSNYASTVPRVVTFNLTAGIRRIDIVKNDSGNGSNAFELMGNIIGTNVRFISGY
jgi:microcystin-dependent protein